MRTRTTNVTSRLARSAIRACALSLLLAADALAQSPPAQTAPAAASAPEPGAASAAGTTPAAGAEPGAVAAPGGDAEPGAAAAPDAGAAVAADAIDARARELYDLAFQALAQEEHTLATSLLRELAALPHPLAERASSLLATLTAREEAAELPSEVPPPPLATDERREKPTGAARAEIAFFQTVHGIALGAETCAIVECQSAQPWALALMLGAGTGFGLSWHFTSDGVRPGLARALTDGVIAGAANGLGIMAATDAVQGGNDEGRVIGAHLVLGQLAGLGVAGGLYHALEPTAGQVSLTASGGIWSLAVTAQAIGMFEPDWSGQTWATVLLVAGDAGLVAGGLLAAEEPMSASRVLLIDAGGLLGALTGYGLSVLVQGDGVRPAPTLGPGLVGTLTGLGLAYYFSAGWDSGEAEAAPARLGLVPVPGGALAMLAGRW